MNAVAPIAEAASLPALVRSAATKLAAAENSAEILDARRDATVAYDAAKIAGRVAKAKQAHDEVISAVYRAQADALEIESMAKRRLADEYDAAQSVEARKGGRPKTVPDENGFTAAEAGLTRKEIHEARIVRDAEAADPGVTRRALDEIVQRGEEPTRAALKREIAAPSRPEPVVSSDALWLWGRLRDFERHGYFTADPSSLLIKMTPQMRADIQRLAPLVRNLMEELEMRFVPA
jgi:hypothetical protein